MGGGPIVVVKQGALRGAKIKSALGRDFISFKGIPYAAPPVEDLRFKDPQPPRSWTGIRDATREGPKSAQIDLISQKIEGQDDCLYLNVSTTSLKGSRSVMVWIHGGAYIAGHGGDDLYGPDYLLEKEIVFVSINYRLGALGFLNLECESVSGNMGLKDQTMALKWVKENIAIFGGDPNNVTIFGESAGGAMVHFHTLSPLSKGLFHKAIAQSGVAVNPWAVVAVNHSYRLVANLGKETTDSDEALNFLRTVPSHRIVEAQYSVINPQEYTDLELPNLFGPVIDTSSPEPFLPRHPRELLENGVSVPFMFGYTDNEGVILVTEFLGRGYPKLDENTEIRAPRDMTKDNPSKAAAVSKELKTLYFGEGPISDEHMDNFIRCLGDMYFLNGIYEIVQVQIRKKMPTYLYKFSYRSASNVARLVFRVISKGTMHFEDIGYLFYANAFPELLPAEGTTERKISDRFVRMWTDFAKTGNPTPCVDDLITTKWRPLNEGVEHCLEIGMDLNLVVNPYEEKWKAWNHIYDVIHDR